jgi:hypothetical protein
MYQTEKLNYSYEELKVSNNTLRQISLLNKKFYSYVANLFQNNIKFEERCFFDQEIKKSLIRSLISFDLETVTFCKYLIADLQLAFDLKYNEIETENCNLMFHLAEDKAEEGTYHYDQIENFKTFTIWSPITEYNYNALSYYSVGYYFYKIFNLLKIIKFIPKKNIIAKKYQPLVWGGYFMHKGNLNNSKDISAAIVVSVKINKNSNNASLNYKYFKIEDEFALESYKKIKFLIDYLILLADSSNKNSLKEILEKTLKKIDEINFFYDDIIISKTLSVISQRTLQFFKENNNYRLLSLLLDSCAIFLDSNQYASNLRIDKYPSKDFDIKYFIKNY